VRVIATEFAVVLVVLGVFLARPAPVVDLDYKVRDLLTGWAGPGKPSGRVVIVEIDEKSLAQFGRWPWPRDLVGLTARSILDHGASVVVLDMMFPQEDRRTTRATGAFEWAPGGTNDEVLAQALSGKPAVAGYSFSFDHGTAGPPVCSVASLPLAVTSPKDSEGAAFFHATGAVCSVPEISRAAAANGFLNAAPDSDGKMRRIPLVIESGGRYYPSLALAALNLCRPVSKMLLATDAHGAWRLRLDRQAVPLEGPSFLRLRFRGAQRSFAYIPVADVLSGRAPADMLRGKIAIVGGSAQGLRNPVVTPVDPLFPDVEIQATAIDNLLQGDSFRRPGNALFWELALALLAGLISALLLSATLHALWGVLIAVGVAAAAWTGCAFVLSSTGMLFSPLAATAALACNLPALTLLHYQQEKRRADRTERQLVSAKHLSREMRRESESRYQRLVENVNDAIIMDDVEGRLVFANRRFREWFGLQDMEIRDVVLEQYVAPEWRTELRDRHDRRMRGETVPDHFEYEGIRPNGTRIWIEALVTRVEKDGRVIGSQGALRDITERKRIEAQYFQAQKMESVGRLAGSVAHDFNNLLTVINGYTDMLLEGSGPQDPLRASLLEIRKAGERAAGLTQKLLAFSRKQLIQPKALDLNLLVVESEIMLGRLIGEDIELITRLGAGIGQAMADAGQLHQVLMNLVVNAIDSMPNGGKIIIETKNVEADADFVSRVPELAIGSYVYLGVTDTGTGMSDHVKEHLFEPFFTTKEPGKGTGLGLATIYSIVHQSSGWIGVTSKLGEGSTFEIYLPRIEPGLLQQPATSVPAAALRGSETVLVVEDQEAVRRLACTILESHGYRVLQASSGPEAIALAEGFPKTIHLLLTDVILPLMDGRLLAEKLKAARPQMAVLYMSGYPDEKIGQSGVLDPNSAYLPKPFTPQALAAKVREILADGKAAGNATDLMEGSS
jgi:PAS domain S-box-containing protein